MNTIDNIKRNQVPRITIFSNEVLSKNKKIPLNWLSKKKNSPNRSSKNKTIPHTVCRGINNFRKPSVTSIANMSECLNFFIFIIQQSSNIRRYEPTYRWKYGFILFEICLYIIWKNSPRSLKLWQNPLHLLSQIRWITLQLLSQIWGIPITNHHKYDEIMSQIWHISVTKCHWKTYDE